MALNAVAGLAYTEKEWASEWQAIVDMASAHPRNQTSTSYQSLEEVKMYRFCLYSTFEFVTVSISSKLH